jgi:hypothetical protein
MKSHPRSTPPLEIQTAIMGANEARQITLKERQLRTQKQQESQVPQFQASRNIPCQYLYLDTQHLQQGMALAPRFAGLKLPFISPTETNHILELCKHISALKLQYSANLSCQNIHGLCVSCTF